ATGEDSRATRIPGAASRPRPARRPSARAPRIPAGRGRRQLRTVVGGACAPLLGLYDAGQPGRVSPGGALMTGKAVAALIAAVAITLGLGWGAASAGVERLYVLDCGENIGKDQSRWSPGVNVGKAIEFSDNCYLIRHDRGLLLWDTGIPDSVAA